ncbi:MAG: threonine-phosphate decarboxylase CobD [Acidimicrobiales bacterium]
MKSTDGVASPHSIPAVEAHGGDGPRIARALGLDPDAVLDLSASMNPVAPDVTAVVARYLPEIRRYPDSGVATAALAGVLGVDPDRILLTNGGAEAIALVAEEFRNGAVDRTEFSLYARHLGRTDVGRRWRSDPHNPSGTLAPVEEVAGVWDEAFYPLATGRWTSGRADTGAIVLGSLTKVFACPGLRLGYVLAPRAGGPELIQRLARRQPRWSVNGLACAAAPELLACADLPGWAAQIVRLRRDLVTLLRECGLKLATSSAANYVLLADAHGLRERLAIHGVVVRDCASFGLEGSVRIAVPDDAGRARLSHALRLASE